MTPLLLSSYFYTHPITLLVEILGERMHGPSPTSNFSGGPSPIPSKSPPMDASIFCFESYKSHTRVCARACACTSVHHVTVNCVTECAPAFTCVCAYAA